MRRGCALLLAATSAASGAQYETLTTTCQNAVAVSAKLSVSSVSDCEAQCDAMSGCNSVDTDGQSCYLKSHCEGTVGSCSGWCGHRQVGSPTPPAPPPGPTPNGTLREAAAKKGIFVGAAGNQGHIQSDSEYTAMLGAQYNLVTAENACKFAATQPQRRQYSYTECDVVANFARQHKMAFRGHNLCWGNNNPSWLSKVSSGEKREVLKDHAATVAGHYGSAAYAWDVVNEAVSDNPGSQPLKNTDWYPSVPDYIDVAFNATRGAVGPGVKLFYNDYNIASMGEGAEELHPRTGERLRMGSQKKSDAVYNLAKSMLARGVPIDGVGLQCHVSDTFSDFDGVAANIARLGALGLEVHITELDVTCNGCDTAKQAGVYAGLLRACLSQKACKNFETWGFTDKYTWKGTGKHPLPFDEHFKKKPAFDAILSGLQ